MTPKQFTTNVICTTILGLVASLVGAISATWWTGALLGLGLALTFTFISQRGLQRLHGNIGNSPVAWYFFDLVLETLLMAILLWGSAGLFGVHIGGTIAAGIGAALVYIVNCRIGLKAFFSQLGMWLATRR